jgi:hypothetical protein
VVARDSIFFILFFFSPSFDYTEYRSPEWRQVALTEELQCWRFVSTHLTSTHICCLLLHGGCYDNQLFINYGVEYFPAREKDYGPIPLDENYEEGNQLMSRFNGLRHDVCISSSSNEEEQTCAATNPTLSMNVQSSLLSLMHNSLADIWQSRTLKTLPWDPQHVDYVLEHGTQFLYQNRSIQSLEWLQENGICIDTIQAGHSTIQQAGRGELVAFVLFFALSFCIACSWSFFCISCSWSFFSVSKGGFATKFIPQGHVVTAVPLIHIPNRDIFTMYGSMPGVEEEGDAQFIRNVSQPIHHQLMLNYCFGHRHSSLLLSPYGLLNTVINHSKENANVKIVWSKQGTRHPEWLSQPVREWGDTKHTGLAFEFVATRNILKGDEVRIKRASLEERARADCCLSYFSNRNAFFWIYYNRYCSTMVMNGKQLGRNTYPNGCRYPILNPMQQPMN